MVSVQCLIYSQHSGFLQIFTQPKLDLTNEESISDKVVFFLYDETTLTCSIPVG